MTTDPHDDDTMQIATIADRRRPGRLENVNPNLLPLLRAGERARLPILVDCPDDEIGATALPSPAAVSGERRLDAGQALALGVILGGLMWAAIIGAGGAALSAL